MKALTALPRAQHPGLRQPAAAFKSQPAGLNVPVASFRQGAVAWVDFRRQAIAHRPARQQAGWGKRQQAAAVQSPPGEILKALAQLEAEIQQGMKELEGMLK